MSEEVVHLETADRVATITLDSPGNRNALSSALMSQLEERLTQAMSDDRARVVVLTHTGPAFCSGADLKELSARAAKGGDPNRLVNVLKRILNSPKPTIARMAGPARAGGLGLVAACDIAVSVDSATFGFSEVRIGVVPGIISVVVLPKLGRARGMELFLTGETIDATEAARLGLITAVVPADELDDATGRYAEAILKGEPAALAGSKRLVREVPGMDVDAAFDFAAELSAQFFASEEAREGMRAFVEKRPPRWAEPT